jgi:hypothetical protein
MDNNVHNRLNLQFQFIEVCDGDIQECLIPKQKRKQLAKHTSTKFL